MGHTEADRPQWEDFGRLEKGPERFLTAQAAEPLQRLHKRTQNSQQRFKTV